MKGLKTHFYCRIRFYIPICCSQSSGKSKVHRCRGAKCHQSGSIESLAQSHQSAVWAWDPRHKNTKKWKWECGSNSIYTIIYYKIVITSFCLCVYQKRNTHTHNHVMCTCQHHGSTCQQNRPTQINQHRPAFPQESNPRWSCVSAKTPAGNCLNCRKKNSHND